jgi:hypothetical protein
VTPEDETAFSLVLALIVFVTSAGLTTYFWANRSRLARARRLIWLQALIALGGALTAVQAILRLTHVW